MIASPTQQDHGYKEADVRRWLTWIASQMQRHDQSVFRIERIQPSWLVHRHEHVIYVMLTRVMAGLIIGVVAASLDMTLSLALPKSSGEGIAGAYWRPLGWGLIAGFSTGLAMLAKMEPRIRAKLGLKSELTGYVLFSMMNAIMAAIGMLIYASIFWWWTDVFLSKGDIVLVGLIAMMHGLLGI